MAGLEVLGQLGVLERLRRAYAEHCRCSFRISLRVLALVLARGSQLQIH